MKNNIGFLVILSLLGISSCQSKLSNERIEDISLIKAEIEIKQSPTDKKENTVSTVLTDKKGRRISNDSLLVYVNDMEVHLSHRQGLYYDDESSYFISNVPVNENYKVELKLYDGKKYLLGEIKPLKEVNVENIECERVGNIDQDFVVKWKDLRDIDELEIMMSIEIAEKDSNSKSYGYRPGKVVEIGSKRSYIVPKSEYVDSTSTITGLEFSFRATKNGKVNSKLIKSSRVTITTSIDKIVNFEG